MTHTGEFVTLPPPEECMPDHRFIALNQHVIEKISFFSLYDCGEPFMKLLRTAHPVHSFLPLVLAEAAPFAHLALVLLAPVFAQASSLAAVAQCAPPACFNAHLVPMTPSDD